MADEKKLEVLNLYKRTRAYVHAPNSMGNDAYPLYKRVDMTSDDVDGGDTTQWLAKAQKDEEWSNKINTNYGSPRNIRRLFIGANNYVVHFWEPIVSKGKQGSERIVKRSSSKKLEYTPEFITSGKNEKYSLGSSKAGLSTLKDWSLKNLEEVYFDWTAIYSKQVPGDAINKMYSLKGVDMANKFVKELFTTFCCRTNNIDKDYPRLKVVAFISNLDKVMENVSTAYTGVGKEGLNDFRLNWLDETKKTHMNILEQCCVAGFYGVNARRLYDKFSSSPNIYEFDKILQEKFRRIAAEIDRLRRESAEANKADNTEENQDEDGKKRTEKSDFEKNLTFYLDAVAKANGDSFDGTSLKGESLKAYGYILDILVNEFGAKEMIDEFAKFSSDGQKLFIGASREKLGIKK